MSEGGTSTCHSGGAKGSDLAWGDAARNAGHEVLHWSFEDHRTRARPEELRTLTLDQMSVARPRLELANATIGRSVPRLGTPVGNLIHRNWFQVKDSRALYAISTFERGKVAGGTAWAVQMFLDLRGGAPCEAYVFNQDSGKWFKWEAGWVAVPNVPVPWGEYAGVGTRDINQTGLRAIPAVYASPPGPRVPLPPASKLPVPFRLPPRSVIRLR